MAQEILVSVKNLVKTFPIQRRFFFQDKTHLNAVSGVSFDIARQETLGLVGESGCGKSTLGRCILGLVEPTHGQVFFKNQDITHLPLPSMRKWRRQMQIIFQDPYAALNPRMTVEALLGEPLEIHKLYRTKEEKKNKILKLLDLCGLRRESFSRYPHEFSGGQRQRICIARALAVEPAFIVCDEPVSALDVSIQAQIIHLMLDLQKELGLTYLFIAHDLKIVEYVSNNIAVMYLGKVVEFATAEELYKNPRHPYTKALFSSIPIGDPTYKRERTLLKGEVPSALSPPSGCSFHPRCPVAREDCKERPPILRGVSQEGEPSHTVSCHYA